ncbi:hypothetical protein CWRG_02889 [Chthonomonas calidirosea]|nr:hypothetical protein CWRG_02889 [Chthonomonas calidirosea]
MLCVLANDVFANSNFPLTADMGFLENPQNVLR